MGTQSWSCPESIPHHGGKPNDPKAEFFTAPPSEIGEVVTAYTTMTKDDAPMEGSKRLTIIAVVALVSTVVVYFLLPDVYAPGAPIAGILFGLMAFAGTAFEHVCSFVGKSGAARATLRGSRSRPPEATVLVFDDARDLELEPVYQSNVEVGPRTRRRSEYGKKMKATGYVFRWRDAQGRELFVERFKNHTSAVHDPEPPYYFAWGIERAWTEHIVPQLSERLRSEGSLAFAMRRGGEIVLGDRQIELRGGESQARLSSTDIESITIDDDDKLIVTKRESPVMLSIKIRPESAAASALGEEYALEYSDINNAQAFVRMMKRTSLLT